MMVDEQTELDRAAEALAGLYGSFEVVRRDMAEALDAIDPRIAQLPAGTVRAALDRCIWEYGTSRDDQPDFTPGQRDALRALTERKTDAD